MQKVLDEMITQALAVMRHAYVPMCKFPVGSCLLSSDEQLFTGCNWENGALPLGVCAETSAISQMLSAGHTVIKSIVVTAEKDPQITPCGACRQRIFEFASDDCLIYTADKKGNVTQTFSVTDMLPNGFRFDLGVGTE